SGRSRVLRVQGGARSVQRGADAGSAARRHSRELRQAGIGRDGVQRRRSVERRGLEAVAGGRRQGRRQYAVARLAQPAQPRRYPSIASAAQMTAIAHYNILEKIGDGGIGEVFRARDTRVGRTVALKKVGPAIAGHPERLQRFLEDARAASALSHPNIATLFDVGEADGVPYLAYEFAAGRSLRDECAGVPMNPRR